MVFFGFPYQTSPKWKIMPIIDHNLGMESHVRHFQAPLCMYAMVINEAPGLWATWPNINHQLYFLLFIFFFLGFPRACGLGNWTSWMMELQEVAGQKWPHP